jgi:hypothetical protein
LIVIEVFHMFCTGQTNAGNMPTTLCKYWSVAS